MLGKTELAHERSKASTVEQRTPPLVLVYAALQKQCAATVNQCCIDKG